MQGGSSSLGMALLHKGFRDPGCARLVAPPPPELAGEAVERERCTHLSRKDAYHFHPLPIGQLGPMAHLPAKEAERSSVAPSPGRRGVSRSSATSGSPASSTQQVLKNVSWMEELHNA